MFFASLIPPSPNKAYVVDFHPLAFVSPPGERYFSCPSDRDALVMLGASPLAVIVRATTCVYLAGSYRTMPVGFAIPGAHGSPSSAKGHRRFVAGLRLFGAADAVPTVAQVDYFGLPGCGFGGRCDLLRDCCWGRSRSRCDERLRHGTHTVRTRSDRCRRLSAVRHGHRRRRRRA